MKTKIMELADAYADAKQGLKNGFTPDRVNVYKYDQARAALEAEIERLQKQLRDASVAAIAEATEVDRLTAEIERLNSGWYDKLLKVTLERDALKADVHALLRQIDIGDFVDSHGHSAKMLRAVHDLTRRMK